MSDYTVVIMAEDGTVITRHTKTPHLELRGLISMGKAPVGSRLFIAGGGGVAEWTREEAMTEKDRP